MLDINFQIIGYSSKGVRGKNVNRSAKRGRLLFSDRIIILFKHLPLQIFIIYTSHGVFWKRVPRVAVRCSIYQLTDFICVYNHIANFFIGCRLCESYLFTHLRLYFINTMYRKLQDYIIASYRRSDTQRLGRNRVIRWEREFRKL